MSIKILITGGAGYIGSVLVEELLKKNYQITVMDLFEDSRSSLSFAFQYDNFDLIKCDVSNTDELLREVTKADVIIPLAALVGAPLCDLKPKLAELVNYKQIVDICERVSRDQLVLYPNTNSGYGLMLQGESFCTERSPLNPISIYGETKVRAENAVIEKSGIAFRLATVFGVSYKMRTDLLVNDFVLRAYKDRSIVLFEGHFRRNFIHVRDVARTFIHAIENENFMRGQVFNVGLSSANLTKLELCKKIQDVIPSLAILQADLFEDPDKRDYLVSNEKLEATGWSPTYELETGILELLKYYRSFKLTQTTNI